MRERDRERASFVRENIRCVPIARHLAHGGEKKPIFLNRGNGANSSIRLAKCDLSRELLALSHFFLLIIISILLIILAILLKYCRGMAISSMRILCNYCAT